MSETLNYGYLEHAIKQISKPKISYVYFWLVMPYNDPDDSDEVWLEPYVKIGLTTDLDRREKELLKMLDNDLDLPDWLPAFADSASYLGWVEGDREVEKYFHQAFKPKSIGREFFEYDDEVEETLDILVHDHGICLQCLKIGLYSIDK